MIDLDELVKKKKLEDLYQTPSLGVPYNPMSDGAMHSKGMYGNLLKTAMDTYGTQMKGLYNSQKANPMYGAYKGLGNKGGNIFAGGSGGSINGGTVAGYTSGGKGGSSSSGSSSGSSGGGK